MAFSFSKANFSPIAIDLGASSIKLLQIVPGDPPGLAAAAAMDVPESAKSDAAARREFVAHAVSTLLKEPGGFKGRRTILSFPAFQTLMQHIEVTRDEGDSLDKAVGAELRQRLGIEPSRMIIRNFPVRRSTRNGTIHEEVICLAAARDVIMGYLDMARRCKLDVVGMHAEPTAVLKAFEHLYADPDDQNRTTCFIDIGAATTKVVIAHGSQMVSAKSIHAGAQSAHSHATSRRQAIDSEGAHAVGTLEAPARIADEALECIVDELKLSLRYHQRMFSDRPIEKLVFLGGVSRCRETCQAVAKAVRIAAQLGDPFARMRRMDQAGRDVGVDLNDAQPGWSVPVGLCLSEANL